MPKLPFKLDLKTITLVLSLLLNILNGTGTVQPLMGNADVECPVTAPTLEPESKPIIDPTPAPTIAPAH